MKKYKRLFNEMSYDFYTEVADTISRNTATNIKRVEEWLHNFYPDKTDVMDFMAKYASSKKWKEIAVAIINDTKL